MSDVDESLYSRQLYVMGHEAQRRLTTSSALVVGLNGLGCEVAKNIILAGLSKVTLYDPTPTTYPDLSANFYLTEEDIGFGRAAVCAPKLAELNPYVSVNLLEDEVLETSLLKNYTVVVLIDMELEKLLLFSDYCHKNGIYLIVADVFGVFGSVFCDFGDAFTVLDSTGENAATSMVANVSNDSPALVTVLEDSRHRLETGDIVSMTELEGGLAALNGREFRVNVKDPYSFEIDVDTSAMGNYVRGGYLTEVKKPRIVSFKTLAEAILDPGMFVGDFSKSHHMGPLHLAVRALRQFRSAYGRLPSPGCLSDATTLYSTCLSLNASTAGFNVEGLEDHESLLRRVAMCARGVVSPVCGILGGVVGQEVLKACSGKFSPIQQWYYLDGEDALPDTPLSEEEVSPLGCRYDGQIMVFGRQMQHKLQKLSMFLVGAGAIGCEMLKTWALMGVSSEGLTHVTDMDHIEKSNLSRQFLFRNKDINQPKSATAACAVQSINPTMRIKAYELKVAVETEDTFNDDFYDSIDMICTALDNVEARLYVDQRCLFYQKPMLESGTQGTKGNTQIVVPRVTESYGATRDPPEQSIPVCTLKHFPNNIAHTLQWAREWFEEIYRQTAEDVNAFVDSAADEYEASLAAQQNMKLDTLTRTHDSLVKERPRTYADCVVWARQRFEDMFNHKIQQLLHSFPLDRVTSSGTLFWSGAKRPPSPLLFSADDPLHLEFVEAAANLRAHMFSLPVQEDRGMLLRVILDVTLPAFQIKEGTRIPATDEEARAMAEARATEQDVDAQCAGLVLELRQLTAVDRVHLSSIDFDKDVDAHMRVVAACSNLRARNYAIPEADLYTSRGIAGRIVPAIATTTALVTGLICLEVYKILLNKPISAHANTFTNLAISLFTSMEPEPPKVTTSVVKGQEWKWTPWDKIVVDTPGITLRSLIALLSSEYGLSLSMLSSGVSILYSDFMNKKKLVERMDQSVKEIFESVSKKQLPAGTKYLILEVIANDEDTDDEVELPYLRLRLY